MHNGHTFAQQLVWRILTLCCVQHVAAFLNSLQLHQKKSLNKVCIYAKKHAMVVEEENLQRTYLLCCNVVAFDFVYLPDWKGLTRTIYSCASSASTAITVCKIIMSFAEADKLSDSLSLFFFSSSSNGLLAPLKTILLCHSCHNTAKFLLQTEKKTLKQLLNMMDFWFVFFSSFFICDFLIWTLLTLATATA